MRLSQDLPSRCARATFALLMAIAWTGAPQHAKAAAAISPPDTSKLAAISDSMEKLARFYAKLDGELSRDTFDPAFVAREVGNDPGKLFAWVREHTAFVPYRGALRGAVGVLMDRCGNSLDRSLLLAKLLQLSGQQVRLAHAPLSQEKCQALLKTFWVDFKSPAPPVVEPNDGATFARVAAEMGVEPAQLRRRIGAQDLTDQKRLEGLVDVVVQQSAALESLLTPPADDPNAARQRAAIADHWWVQQFDGVKWIDLDLLSDGAKVGEALASPSGTVPLPADTSWALPEDPSLLKHEVEIKVVVERTVQNASQTAIVLTQTFRPGALGGESIALQLAPLDWPADLDVTGSEGRARLKGALLAQKRWVPVFMVAGQTVYQGGFDSHGVVNPNPPMNDFGKVGNDVNGKLNGVGNLLDPAAPAPPESTGTLTAVWMDFEIRIPGEKPRTIRRDLFDAFGPARRAKGMLSEPVLDEATQLRPSAALAQHVTLLPIGFVPSAEFLTHLALTNLVGNAPRETSVLREAASGKKTQAQAVRDLAPIPLLPVPVLFLSAARRGPPGLSADFAVDRPNVFALYEGFAIKADGTPTARAEVDIIANEVAVRAPDGAAAFKSRLRQGVFETAGERLALRRPAASVNTVSLWAASGAQNVQWVKFAAVDDPAFSRVGLAPDVLSRIRNDIASGYVVVAPVGPIAVGGQPREGWWRIDPRDGSCIGFGADGRGNELIEYAVVFMFILYDGYKGLKCAEEHGTTGLQCAACFALAAVIDIFDMYLGMAYGGASVGRAADVGLGAVGAGALCDYATGPSEGGGGGGE